MSSSASLATVGTAPAGELTAPVTRRERLVSIDVLRGVALLGILLLNIKSFSMPDAAYMNPTAYGDLTGANHYVWLFTAVFGDGKFMSIFSMLFGAGVVLMTDRAEAKTGRSAALHYRRTGWLILFGLLHGYLIWHGDILYVYGMCGLVVYPMRRLPPVVLVVIAAVLLFIAVMVWALNGLAYPLLDEVQRQMYFGSMWMPAPELIEQEIATYRSGWAAQMVERVPNALMMQTAAMLFLGPHVLALMLLGVVLQRWGVFSAGCSARFYAMLIGLGAAVGLPLVIAQVAINEAINWRLPEALVFTPPLNTVGSVFMALGYVGIVMLICKAVRSGALLRPLAAVGQMALTNYIMQSVICTLIFYGHGLGLFGQLERIEQMGVVAGVWVVQLIVSPLWLSVFRFGPLEWLWRSLTYMRPQPVLRAGPAAELGARSGP